MDDRPDLSVVIISRNEAEHIARTIESVLRAVKRWPETEILLVDSASTDRTVEIACRYPINVVQLGSSWFLSAAAGRRIGLHYTQGDLVMYLDGDMELAAEWPVQAVPFLWQHPELAGVAGRRRDIYVHDGKIIGEHSYEGEMSEHPVKARYLAGGALYRRSALEQVGGFNPYIISSEEPELSLRLRRAGYELMLLPYVMCRNYTLPINSWEYFVRRFRRGMFLGPGQVLRYHLKTGIFGMALREIAPDAILFAAGILGAGAVGLLTAVSRSLWGLAVCGGCAGAVFVGYWIKKQRLSSVLTSIVGRILNVYGIIHGFLKAPRPPNSYPTEAKVIQTNYHLGGMA
jgi:glycosyltransferase involved in cell wall biosynthesis